MDNPSGPGDEIAIDPFPTPNIPIPRAARAIASRISREWPAGNWRRLTWQGWLLAAIAAVVVIGALKLAGVIWTSAPPRWVPALGTGVTVTEPGQVAPGHGSPGAAVVGVLAALSSKDPAAFCKYSYAYASSVAQCEAGISRTPTESSPLRRVRQDWLRGDRRNARAGRNHWQGLPARQYARVRDERRPVGHLLHRERPSQRCGRARSTRPPATHTRCCRASR